MRSIKVSVTREILAWRLKHALRRLDNLNQVILDEKNYQVTLTYRIEAFKRKKRECQTAYAEQNDLDYLNCITREEGRISRDTPKLEALRKTILAHEEEKEALEKWVTDLAAKRRVISDVNETHRD